MLKTIKVKVRQENYFQVLGIIEKYAKGTVRIHATDSYNEIEFDCGLIDSYICKQKLKTAKELEMILEVEA